MQIIRTRSLAQFAIFGILAFCIVMAASQQLIPYLHGLERLLEGVSVIGGAPFTNTSQEQSQKVCNMLCGAPIQIADGSSAIEIVARLRWAEVGHKDAVVAAISKAISNAPRRMHQRGAYQYFRSVGNFLTDDHWKILWRVDVAPPVKLNLLMGMSAALGLRIPSERTYAVLTAIFLLVTDRIEKAQSFPASVVRRVYDDVKDKFKAEHGNKASTEWVQNLPTTPAELRDTHKSLYDELYAVEPAVACEIPSHELFGIVNSFKLRDHSKGKQAVDPMSLDVLAPMVRKQGGMEMIGRLLQTMCHAQHVSQSICNGQGGSQLSLPAPPLAAEGIATAFPPGPFFCWY